MTAPVLLVFYSRTRMPESGTLADDIRSLSAGLEGRFLAGLVGIDAAPAIAQAMQIPSIPLVVLVLDGRPMPLLQDPLPIDELRTALTQVMQQVTAQGVTTGTSRGPPALPSRPRARSPRSTRGTPRPRTRSARATSSGRWRSTRSSSTQPGGREASAGLAMAKVLHRTQGVDLQRPAPQRPTPRTMWTPRRWWPTWTCSAATSRTRSAG